MLVNVQSFAVSCGVRCGAMALMDSAGPMAGMGHCHGMGQDMGSDAASRPPASHGTVFAAIPSQLCVSHICKSDWALQNRAGREAGLSHLPVIVLSVAVKPIADLSRRNNAGGRQLIPAFDPIVSILRI